jgi:hypothetical protein
MLITQRWRRAVLRRCAVAQHVDALYGKRGNGFEISSGIATGAAAVDIDQRHRVLTLAIDEHQRLVGPEAAQRCGVNMSAPSGADLTIGLNEGSAELQELCDIEAARALQQPGYGI